MKTGNVLGNALGGEREKDVKETGLNKKREDPVSSKAPDIVPLSREEYALLEKFKEDYAVLVSELSELHNRYFSIHPCGRKTPLEQIKDLEKIIKDSRIDASTNMDRCRGLMGAVVHLGHYCDDTERKMREYIQNQKGCCNERV